MNSFNVYEQTTETIGGNTPVWLGTVKPVPVGASSYAESKRLFPAGSLVSYNAQDKTFEVRTGISEDVINSCNGYLYNDINVETDGGTFTGAIVMHHPEGLLIERVYPEITEEQIAQLQAKIPGVLLVRG